MNQNRAIVTPTPGTTRDWLTEWIDLDGFAVSITDTAGVRTASGIIEKEGQKSALYIMKESDLIIWMVDISKRFWRKELEKDIKDHRDLGAILVLFNKIDKLNFDQLKAIKKRALDYEAICVSCKTKSGLKLLEKELVSRISRQMPDLTDSLVVTSERHKKKLDRSLKFFRKAERGLRRNLSPELIAFDLRQGINEIDEITGRVYNEEILDRIFSRFCIGK